MLKFIIKELGMLSVVFLVLSVTITLSLIATYVIIKFKILMEALP